MEFTDQESEPNLQHSITAPLAPNIPSNPSASPPQTLITSYSSPLPPPPSVPQPPSAIASPPPVLPSRSTFTSAPASPRFANNHDDDPYFNSFPPGYRFCPHDHELVLHYLTKKVKGLPLPRNRIVDVTLYQYDPEFLADKYKPCGEKEWYFFTPRDRKYKNGSRPNRAANGGYWKATGADKQVTYDQAVVGFRKALVYYNGKAPKGDKTNWIMHEFRVNDPSPQVRNHRDDMRLDDWVLCRIYKKHEKRTNVNNNVRNGQRNEERSSGSMHYIDEYYLNCHDHNSNYLAAMEAECAEEIFDMGTGSLENLFPILDELSQQQTTPNGFSDAINFSPAPAISSRTLQDTQVPSLAETFGNPAPMLSINPDNCPYRQKGYQDEFLNPTNWSQVNIPDQFYDRYSGMPTYFPRYPAPLVNLRPTNTDLPAHGLPYINSLLYMNTASLAGSLPPVNTACPTGRLSPVNTARPSGCLPPTNTALLTSRLPPTNPENSQPMSVRNIDAKLPRQPPQHL